MNGYKDHPDDVKASDAFAMSLHSLLIGSNAWLRAKSFFLAGRRSIRDDIASHRPLKRVFALFSVENNYDQPENNLVTLWEKYPTFQDVSQVFPESSRGKVGDLFRGGVTRIGNTDYRIEPVDVIQNNQSKESQ